MLSRGGESQICVCDTKILLDIKGRIIWVQVPYQSEKTYQAAPDLGIRNGQKEF